MNTNTQREYVIWGIPPHSTDNIEELLATHANGELITEPHIAKIIAQKLTNLGCKEVRIQTINLHEPLPKNFFTKTINKFAK
jgi:phosphoribosylpyrophosphate synthetase